MQRHRAIGRRVAGVVLLAAGVALGACSDDDDNTNSAESSTTEAADQTSTTASSTTAVSQGCSDPAPEMSQPANTGEIVDIDGDGRRDTAWLASPASGGRELGVLTAAGGGDRVMIDSASPVALTLLVADADEQPPVELFVSDNRTVQLWTFVDCSLQPVTDTSDQPYQFDLGFRGTGTGVGCIDADGDGRRDLVGLNVTATTDTTVEWSRTIIERDGVQASNGPTDTGTYRRSEDDAEIELLYTVTCGDASIDQDGIRQP
jgi:hypothetical protein